MEPKSLPVSGVNGRSMGWILEDSCKNQLIWSLENMGVIDIMISRDTNLVYPVVLCWEEVPEPIQVTARVGSRVQEVQRQERCHGTIKGAQLVLRYHQPEHSRISTLHVENVISNTVDICRTPLHH
jgi:hypothetical protein